MIDLTTLPGREESSGEVRDAIRAFALDEAMEAAPHRKGPVSRARGIDLLFESAAVLAGQIHVEPRRRCSGFQEALPYGITRGLRQADLHALLGALARHDRFDSQHGLEDRGIRLIAVFDDSSVIQDLSFERSPSPR